MNASSFSLSLIATFVACVAVATDVRAQDTAPAGVFGQATTSAASVSMGNVSHSLKIEVPVARGAAQGALTLTYGGGLREAGLGWGLNVPSIERSPLSGWPTYADPPEGTVMAPRGTPAVLDCSKKKTLSGSGAATAAGGGGDGPDAPDCTIVTPEVPAMDRMAFGGNNLVPVCTIGRSKCPDGEQFPAWAFGWHYFRAQHDSYQRFFWSPDSYSWRVQNPSGITEEYGTPLIAKDIESYGVDWDRQPVTGRSYAAFRWNLVRAYDTARDGVGDPVNVVLYIYGGLTDAYSGRGYLTDVYDTPSTTAGINKKDEYAHHTGVQWESSGDAAVSHARIWHAGYEKRIALIDVTSKPWLATSGARELTRRYHLTYKSLGARSQLEHFWMEGRCKQSVPEAPIYYDECAPKGSCPNPNVVVAQRVPPTNCESLPAMTFDYSPSEAEAFESDALPAWTSFAKPMLVGDDPRRVIGIDANSDGLLDLAVVEGDYTDVPSRPFQRLFINDGGATFRKGGRGFHEVKLLTPDASDSYPLTAASRQLLSPTNGTSLLAGWSPFGDSSVLFFAGASGRDPDSDGSPVTFTESRFFTLAPAAGGAWQWKGGSHSGKLGAFDQDGVADVDGDGFPDTRKVWGNVPVPAGSTPGNDVAVTFADRLANGEMRATGRHLPGNWPDKPDTILNFEKYGLSGRTSKAAALADLDGDGLADLVPFVSMVDNYLAPQEISVGDIYFPGDGTGQFGCTRPSACSGQAYATMTGGRTTHPESKYDVKTYDNPLLGPILSFTRVHFVDVNADGFDDIVNEERQVDWDRGGEGFLGSKAATINIVLNRGGKGWSKPLYFLHPARNEGQNYEEDHLVFGDVNGNGTTDIVAITRKSVSYIDLLNVLADEVKPGLLVSVDSGLGARSTYAYETTSELAHASATPWNTTLPHAGYVVTSAKTTNGLPSSMPRETVYGYEDPIYDPWSRRLRGFEHVRVTQVGDASSPTEITDTVYEKARCHGMPLAASCLASHLDNDTSAPLEGLPAHSTTMDAAGTWLSTTTWSNHLRTRNPVGMDNRVVMAAYTSTVDTVLYDTAVQNGLSPTTKAVEISPAQPSYMACPGQVYPGNGAAAMTSPAARAAVANAVNPFLNCTLVPAVDAVVKNVPFASKAKSAHLRLSKEIDEATGLETKHTDWGRVGDDGNSPDDPIVSETIYDQVSAETRWLFQKKVTVVHPFAARSGVPAGLARQVHYEYDAAGRENKVIASLVGSGTIDRRHEGNGAVAPVPTGAARDGDVTLVSRTFDVYGHTTHEEKVDGTCTEVEFDAAYATLPATLTTFEGGCGVDAKYEVETFDRGLGLLTLSVNFGAQMANATGYDTFGRVAKMFAQDTKTPISPSDLPARVFVNKLGNPVSSVHVTTFNGESVATETWSFVDAFGKPVLSFASADPAHGDHGTWIVQPIGLTNSKGLVISEPEPTFTSLEPPTYPLAYDATLAHASAMYDAFGRPSTATDPRNKPNGQSIYHALSIEHRDAEQSVGTHRNAKTLTERDGHGRIEYVRQTREVSPGKVADIVTHTLYQSTGEVAVVERGSGTELVKRWMQYDSFGNLVVNAEPHSSRGFSGDPATTNYLKTWRYAYDTASRLIATSDARGCGVNFHFDAGGRPIAEDVSPCLISQPAYTPITPGLTDGNGTEVYTRYDNAGRVASVEDEASRTITHYDARGRTVSVERQIAAPGAPASNLEERYAPHVFVRTTDYDDADRVVRQSTGADVAELLDRDPALASNALASNLWLDYSARGVVRSVRSSYGDGLLVPRQEFEAYGALKSFELGDATHIKGVLTYDGRRRLETVNVARALATCDVTRPATLEAEIAHYDEADNLLKLEDKREACEWTDGAKPVKTRDMVYDDAYRVTSVTYATDDIQVSPVKAELARATHTVAAPALQPKRVTSQSFAFDWKGNTTRTDDNAHAFADRSVGRIENNEDDGKPYQLTAAGPLLDDPNAAKILDDPARSGLLDDPHPKGALLAQYDDAGSMTTMLMWQTTCADAGACVHAYRYDWDPRGRLARARRWDAATLRPFATDAYLASEAVVDLTYAYDAGGARVRKTSEAGGVAAHTLDVFPSLRVVRAAWVTRAIFPPDPSESLAAVRPNSTARVATGGGEPCGILKCPPTPTYISDYDLTAATEQVYLGAWAHVTCVESDVAAAKSGQRRVLFTLGDHLKSTTTVIDKDRGELVEKTSYQAYGATESDYRPEAWGSFREELRFTGKEDDLDVGLTYFGARYYSPMIGRWISADPMTVHSGGADPNLYAYVAGRVSTHTDSTGLVDDDDLTVDGFAPLEIDRWENDSIRSAWVWSPVDNKYVYGTFEFESRSSDAAELAYGMLYAWKRFNEWVRSGTFDRAAYNRATSSGLQRVQGDPALHVTDEIVRATPEAASNAFFVLSGSAKAPGAVPAESAAKAPGGLRVRSGVMGTGRGAGELGKVQRLAANLPATMKRFGACTDFADAMRAQLVKMGVKGSEIRIKVGNGVTPYSDSVGRLAERGMGHSAIRVGDVVFDNLRSEGIPYADFIQDLGGDAFFGSGYASISETPF